MNKKNQKKKKTLILLSIIALTISVFFSYCFYLSANISTTDWVTQRYLLNSELSFTISYPPTWFFGEGGPVLTNYSYDDAERTQTDEFLPTDVKCDVVDFRSEEVEITNPINISEESHDSYKIIRGNGDASPIYQIDSNGKKSLHVVCYAFSESDAKIVDQIVKTIRY